MSTREIDPRLGLALKKLRDGRHLTQEDVAYSAGITTGTLSRTETSETSPTWDTVLRIADALEVSLIDLVAAVEREG